MTRDEFTSMSIAILRSALGWQSAIARRLGVRPREVRRWLQAGATPPWVDEAMKGLMGAKEAVGPWPRDEWLIGDAVTDDGSRREYIAHLVPPRFVARIVECDPEGAPRDFEEPADIVSGVVYVADATDAEELGGQVLCEIDWIDEVPAGQMTQLLEAAADAIEAQDERDFAERHPEEYGS